MRQIRDTFIHFVADNIAQYITTSTPTVNGVWRSSAEPNRDTLNTAAINISFLDGTYSTATVTQVCAIDVIHTDELTAVDWTDALWQLLSATCYTPQLDYSGVSPVPTGKNVVWPIAGVRFKPIVDKYYFRQNCRLLLTSS